MNDCFKLTLIYLIKSKAKALPLLHQHTQTNGVGESKHHRLLNVARTLLFSISFTKVFSEQYYLYSHLLVIYKIKALLKFCFVNYLFINIYEFLDVGVLHPHIFYVQQNLTLNSSNVFFLNTRPVSKDIRFMTSQPRKLLESKAKAR
ncbi:hypothetical protein V2J09_010601 [Rumex salicifolius]